MHADSTYNKLWSAAELYGPEDDGWLRSISLSGRLQAETTRFDADQGNYDDTLWRRFRFGAKSQIADHWEVHIEADLDLNEYYEDWYNRLTDAYIAWSPTDAIRIKALKHSAGFTLDGATSSKKLLTLQRNNLTNNLWFTAEYFSGIDVSGSTANNWQYRASVFSSDGDDEIGIQEASWFTMVAAGYDVGPLLGLDKALLRLDYVYNDEDRKANTRDLSHVVSLSGDWQQGKWHLRTDFAYADGHFGQGDLWGLVLMPYYDVHPNLQLLARYTWLDSDDDAGVRLGRYENEIVDQRGDNYHEFYLGLNFFLYGHKFKWQAGAQYTTLSGAADYDGWGITTGPRVYW